MKVQTNSLYRLVCLYLMLLALPLQAAVTLPVKERIDFLTFSKREITNPFTIKVQINSVQPASTQGIGFSVELYATTREESQVIDPLRQFPKIPACSLNLLLLELSEEVVTAYTPIQLTYIRGSHYYCYDCKQIDPDSFTSQLLSVKESLKFDFSVNRRVVKPVAGIKNKFAHDPSRQIQYAQLPEGTYSVNVFCDLGLIVKEQGRWTIAQTSFETEYVVLKYGNL